jgi:hypothetical protein
MGGLGWFFVNFNSFYLLVPEKCCTFAAQNQILRRYEEADT